MDRILESIHAFYAYERGYYGQGIGVAVLDTGAALHEDLKDKILYFKDYVNNKNQVYDDNGHGTHISGIIAGGSPYFGYEIQKNQKNQKMNSLQIQNGVQKGVSKKQTGSFSVKSEKPNPNFKIPQIHGVAPASRLYIFKVLDRSGNGMIEDTCHAVEDIIEMNQNQPGKIRIINMSVGMTSSVKPDQQVRLIKAVETAWDQGIVVIAAAGNNGPGENTITSPGISKKIITVGSLDDGWSMGKDRGYSGRGPTAECVVKPEILMPGTDILSCQNRKNGYTRKSGTSMAVPVLSGVIALLLNAYPFLSPNEVKMRLFYGAQKLSSNDNRKCWGTILLDHLL